MSGKHVLLFLLISFFFLRAKADVFTVTSNADSGPGTLGEALTLAASNGSAVKDFIYFNLPDLSEAGRTIALSTQLPAMTSNLLIDGTTQPGSNFGISDAKVQITLKFVYPDQLNVLHSDGADFIEIYGLWINCDSSGWGGAAIEIDNFNKVIIGSPARGNIINGANIGIHTGKICIFQNNNCGTDITGELPGGGNVGISCDDVTVGGSANTGNIFFKMDVTFENYLPHHLILSYNKYGTNFSGTKRVPLNSFAQFTRLVVQGIDAPTNNQIPVDAVINNNIFVDEYFSIILLVTNLSGQINIQGNSFNTDPTGSINYLANVGFFSMTAIGVSATANILIGGENPGQKNLIAYSALGIAYEPLGTYTIMRNSIFCVGEVSFAGFVNNDKLPQVQITSISPTGVLGTASPGADVELFYADCNCTNVSAPKDYFATVKADANGNWTYSGAVSGNVMVSATLNNLTGLFTGADINEEKLFIVDETCGKKGSITGISTPYNYGYRWYNNKNELVGSQRELLDKEAGMYTLKVGPGNECDITKTYEIKDASITVDLNDLQYKDATCASPGSITGVSIQTQSAQFYHRWIDTKGVVVCDCTNLDAAPAGRYTFEVGNNDGTCKQTFGPFIVKNTDGPNIDESARSTQPSNCNSTTGAITGVYATGGTGILTYSWRNIQDQEVGNQPDLNSQPAGKYRLRVTDDSQCNPVYSSEYVIPEVNGVSLDLSDQGGRSATCNENNGSITGLKTTGATTYQWMVTGTTDIVSDKLDLLNMPAGFYTLTISNATCSKSYDFEVAGFPPTVFTGITYTKTKTCDGAGNGTITLNTTNANEEPTQYLWLDEQGNPVGYTKEVQFLKAGKYRLQLTNKNFCPVLYPEVFTIEAYPKLEIKSYGTVTNATCGVGTGSITATQFIGGSSNYTYQWYDENNNAIPGKTDAFLNNLVPGKYRLHLEDGTCNPGDVTYPIADEAVTPPPPSADNIQVYNTGAAVIKINNPFPTAIYRLYETATSPQPIKDTIGGNITVNVTESRSYYVSLTYGYCESTRTQVKVFLSALNGNIPNTFTPNNDGINDYWNIPGLDTYPNATVNIFNRYGQAVFQSVGYANPFDGNRNGKPLPTGVYYYIINLKRGDVLSGNVTILR